MFGADGANQAIGNVLSTAIGVVAANHGAYKQYKYNKKLQAQAAKLNYDYGIKSLQNSPSAQRQGLESAGYNPMLAVQNSTTGANAGWTSNSSVEAPDYPGAISAGIANAQSFKRLENETRTAESQIKTNEATAENQSAEAANKRAQNPYISKQAEAELGKTSAETAKLRSDTEYNSAMIENMKSRLELDRALGFAGINIQREGNRIADYNSRTARENYNLQREMFEGSQDKFMSDYAKKHPHLYGLYRHADNAFGLAGRVLGASSSFNNHEMVERVNFDKNGVYNGHTTTSKHRSRKRR